jgi:hypothetical protein
MRATAHSTATSRLVSEEEEEDAGMALRTPRASPDSPPGAELEPLAEAPPPAEAPVPRVVAAADPLAPLCAGPPLVAELLVEPLPARVAAGPGGLPASAIAPWPLLVWPPRWTAEVLPWRWCLWWGLPSTAAAPAYASSEETSALATAGAVRAKAAVAMSTPDGRTVMPLR